MRTKLFAWLFVTVFTLVFSGLVAAKRSDQSKFGDAQEAKSSDPAVRWRFDTHG
jgi:hypothetical protein